MKPIEGLNDYSNTADMRNFILEQLIYPLEAIGTELAIFLVYDRPNRSNERKGLTRSYFRERCISNENLRQMIDSFRLIGAYVELFNGEHEFINALSSGKINSIRQKFKVAYNGIEGSIAHDGFMAGRKALIPALSDAYDIFCANSSPYACALGRHKFHYLTILSKLNLPVPSTWHYHLDWGWAGGNMPPSGIKIIVKSTYESWSVGVTEESVFYVNGKTTERVKAIAESIGQSVTVQEFIDGSEICIPVFTSPNPLATPPVKTILLKDPDNPKAFMTIDDNLKPDSINYQIFDESSLSRKVQNLATRAFMGLELNGLARIDLRIDEQDNPFIFDVGVSPSLSEDESSFTSFSALNLNHKQFLHAVIASSLTKYMP